MHGAVNVTLNVVTCCVVQPLQSHRLRKAWAKRITNSILEWRLSTYSNV